MSKQNDEPYSAPQDDVSVPLSEPDDLDDQIAYQRERDIEKMEQHLIPTE